MAEREIERETRAWTPLRVTGWIGGTVLALFLAGVVGGFLAAHFDHGTGAEVWRDRLMLAVPALVFAILAGAAALALRRSWPREPGADADAWERRTVERKRRTLLVWVVPGFAAAVTMLAVGGAVTAGVGTPAATALIVVAVVAGLVAAAGSTYFYMRVIDEQERQANLWCGYVGVATYLFLYMAQLLARQVDPALPRFDDTIFGLTALAAVVTFLRLKFR